ncbi:MAG: hypothetical protein EOP84_12040 [Verrucomicrobiaceae bacterium]|nr:MAG: hypothetical protein EOP84_12040 [Verrucomicrobiaceae bacterium]
MIALIPPCFGIPKHHDPPILFSPTTLHLSAQELSPPTVERPSGYNETPKSFGFDPAEQLMGLEFGLDASLVYDSNFFQAPNNSLVGDQQETTFMVSPTITYRRKGAEFAGSVSLTLDYYTYFENPDFNGLGYNLDTDLSYHGGPLTVTGAYGTSKTQGSNRYLGGTFSETIDHRFSLSASYQWSPKTSFDSRFNYHWSSPEQATFSTIDDTSFDLSAMWQATPLFRVGPGVAYSISDGERQVERETIGPIVRAQYQLGNRVALDGTLGLEFVDYGGVGGGDDTSYSAKLGISYVPSVWWSANFSLYHGTSADEAAAGAFRETTSIRLGVNRRIYGASLGLGASYSMDDSTRPSGIGGPGSSDYFSIDTSLGMPILADRGNISIFYSWRQESGGGRDWDGHQVGLSISSKY